MRLGANNGPRSIDRVDRQTVVHVSANVAPGIALSNVDTAFSRRLADLSLPLSVHVAPSSAGNQQNLSDTINGMVLALVLGVVLVFLLMVALYNSYITPLIIMMSVPLAVVGAIGALALTHETLNAFSFIGAVLLIGLVSKNGILLVDFANQLRMRGMDRLSAIRESARLRFRPDRHDHRRHDLRHAAAGARLGSRGGVAQLARRRGHRRPDQLAAAHARPHPRRRTCGSAPRRSRPAARASRPPCARSDDEDRDGAAGTGSTR